MDRQGVSESRGIYDIPQKELETHFTNATLLEAANIKELLELYRQAQIRTEKYLAQFPPKNLEKSWLEKVALGYLRARDDINRH